MANLCSWLFLLGPAPFAFCFASLLDGETQIWLGDLRFAFCVVVFVFCSVFDLPCYMTTGVNVDFISNCFFTCKDRALERDRPYQRKNTLRSSRKGFLTSRPGSLLPWLHVQSGKKHRQPHGFTVKSHAWENQQHACYGSIMGLNLAVSESVVPRMKDC